jgi:ribosomal protein L44E
MAHQLLQLASPRPPARHSAASSNIPEAEQLTPDDGRKRRKRGGRGGNKTPRESGHDVNKRYVLSSHMFVEWAAFATGHGNLRGSCARPVVVPVRWARKDSHQVWVSLQCQSCSATLKLRADVPHPVQWVDSDDHAKTRNVSQLNVRAVAAAVLGGKGPAALQRCQEVFLGTYVSPSTFSFVSKNLVVPAILRVMKQKQEILLDKMARLTELGVEFRVILDERYSAQNQGRVGTEAVLVAPVPVKGKETFDLHPALWPGVYEIVDLRSHIRGLDVTSSGKSEVMATIESLDMFKRRKIAVTAVVHDDNKEVSAVITKTRNCLGKLIGDELDGYYQSILLLSHYC